MALAIPSFFSAGENIVAKHIIYRQVYIVAKHIVLIFRNDKSEFDSNRAVEYNEGKKAGGCYARID